MNKYQKATIVLSLKKASGTYILMSLTGSAYKRVYKISRPKNKKRTCSHPSPCLCAAPFFSSFLLLFPVTWQLWKNPDLVSLLSHNWCFFLSIPSGEDRAGTGSDSDMAAPPEMPIVIDHIALKDILGPQLYEMEVSMQLSWSYVSFPQVLAESRCHCLSGVLHSRQFKLCGNVWNPLERSHHHESLS